ncbi:hypothetical protein [uncultured Lactobacillus sp.]|uniref:hypothetical protein n=1 Tax=uncultured Lactobacillus sp. TaxID=153152 RepID=UPI00262E7DA4|nr:hypothetical protein [uncultured Lactobacillus sp.]
MFETKKWKTFKSEGYQNKQRNYVLGYYYGFFLVLVGIFGMIYWLFTIHLYGINFDFAATIFCNVFFWSGLIVEHIFRKKEQQLEKTAETSSEG